MCFLGPQTLSPENAVEVDDLFEIIFNNGFARLWVCRAVGVVPLSASDTWSIAPSFRFLYVPMKTSKDYERLVYTCPNLRWIPSSKDASVDLLNLPNIGERAKPSIWNDLNGLIQLEVEDKFISEVNPFAVLKNPKRRSYTQQQNSVVIYGRIFPQVEPHCHASFLIEIRFSPEYPFRNPEITFLDPIENPNIDDRDFSISTLDAEKPPKDVAEQLLQYVDILYPNGEPINTVTNTVRNAPPVYKDEVIDFFHIVDVYAQDLNYDTLPTYQMTYNRDKIAKTNWRRIKQMLASLSRAARLSLYNNAYAIEHGRVKWILLRLKELIEE